LKSCLSVYDFLIFLSFALQLYTSIYDAKRDEMFFYDVYGLVIPITRYRQYYCGADRFFSSAIVINNYQYICALFLGMYVWLPLFIS